MTSADAPVLAVLVSCHRGRRSAVRHRRPACASHPAVAPAARCSRRGLSHPARPQNPAAGWPYAGRRLPAAWLSLCWCFWPGGRARFRPVPARSRPAGVWHILHSPAQPRPAFYGLPPAGAVSCLGGSATGLTPQAFKVVEVTGLIGHNVDHYVDQVDQHPVGRRPAFGAVRTQAGGFGFFFHITGYGGDMTVGGTGGDNHPVGDGGTAADV